MNKCPIVSRVTLIIPVPINHKISYPRMPIQPILILIAITLVNCARTRITYVNSALAEFVIFIFSTYSARSFIARLASRIRPAASRTRVPSREIGERFLLGDRSFTITNQRYLKFLQFNHFALSKTLDRPVFHHLVYIQHSHPPMRFPSSIIVHPLNKITYLGKRDMYIQIFIYLAYPVSSFHLIYPLLLPSLWIRWIEDRVTLNNVKKLSSRVFFLNCLIHSDACRDWTSFDQASILSQWNVNFSNVQNCRIIFTRVSTFWQSILLSNDHPRSSSNHRRWSLQVKSNTPATY